jgi:ribonuclease P protein component
VTSAPGGGGREQRLPRSWRITRSSEIRALFQRGKRSRTRHLDVFDSASPAAFPRVGVVVPRYGHRIVERNRLKRRMREILRRRILPALRAGGVTRDLLVRARREAYEASFTELEAELVQWLEQQVGARGSSSS